MGWHRLPLCDFFSKRRKDNAISESKEIILLFVNGTFSPVSSEASQSLGRSIMKTVKLSVTLAY